MLKPYEKYQNTEYDWLGLIPLHWQWLYLSQTCTEKKQIKNTGNIEKKVLSLSYGKIVPRKNVDLGLAPKDYSSYQIVDKNDIILRLTDLQNDKKSLRTGLVKERGIITSAYTCLKPFQNAAYLQYLLHSYDTQKVFYGMGGGVRQSIGYKDIRNIRIPFPPREEQDQIVRFLDWKLAKINKLIRAKKKQIALLNEQRQAIIHNAVTKGVDPNVPMKDSGIEWIGQIPQEWVVNRLKTQISLSTSKKNRDNEFYIGMENIQSWTGKYVSTTEIDSEGICNIFENNNILFGKLRPYLAKVYLTENNGVCSSEFLVLKNFNGILRYMFYVLLSYKFIDLVNSSTYGAKMPRANWGFIGNCSIPIPSLEEQNKIASYLDDKCYKIENLKAKIQNEIELLYEYRTRLISDVVTGKVDVRDIEIPEYEADSDETIDDEIDDNLVLDEEDGEMEVE